MLEISKVTDETQKHENEIVLKKSRCYVIQKISKYFMVYCRSDRPCEKLNLKCFEIICFSIHI